MRPDELAWVMVYASILGIAHHPRQMENGGRPSMTPEQAAKATDEAMKPWAERFGTEGERAGGRA